MENSLEKIKGQQQGRQRRVHAFEDDALGHDDAVALTERLKKGRVSAKELAKAAIDRAERVDGILHAIQLRDYDYALASAHDPAQGIFSGIPTFIKDNTDVRGLPTNHGSCAFVANPAKKTGAFARQYMAQGFTLLGKSTLPEFGFNATTEFMDPKLATRNPWHTEYSCGASSGGSAALVAAGVIPIAHANDGGGSIRIPAACCGLVGLKPTRGRLVDGEAARSLPINIIGEGVVTRSVRDTAAFFAGAERYWRNPKLPELGLIEGPGSRRLKIGLVTNSIMGTPISDETRAVVTETATLLESMGHIVVETPLPVTDRFGSDFTVYWGLMTFLVSKFGKRLFSPDFDPSKLDGLTQGLAALYREKIWGTIGVLRRLRGTTRTYRDTFRDYDLILSPVLCHAPPKLGHLSPEVPFDTLLDRLEKYTGFTPYNNISGGPAISLPMGTSAEGLPIGVHFSADHGDEKTLLEIAFALEEAKPWATL
ncbi:amidase [Alcanivorax sp. 24]|uniref:amidase n=1 Tax=Alcanivorax sp. 24 TaxID=2545266 RepID=UPI00105EC2F6|nr:amidase [Alcanivorax sp. 24]